MLKTLSGRYPVVNTQLDHETPFQLLVATILSAQCTDKQVNKVTAFLFKKYPDPKSLSDASMGSIKRIIFSTGFYNNKAKNIKACAKTILNQFDNRVPENIDQLVTLPGVGRKTANVVLSMAFGHQTIVVDTHVARISQRLGITRFKDPVKIEFDLMQKIPKPSWNDLCLQFIYLGRDLCIARKPKCDQCPLAGICSFYMQSQ